MNSDSTLLTLVQTRIDAFLHNASDELTRISPDTGPLIEHIVPLLSSGKRFRTRFCYWGWRAGDDPGTAPDEARHQLEAVLRICTGLEFFHAAALVHDDVIDRSDIRRGRPSAHVFFRDLHIHHHWAGDPAQFGDAAAIVLGDVLLGWSHRIFAEALELIDEPRRATVARTLASMGTDVMIGQYLDIQAEQQRPDDDFTAEMRRAQTVITYKSARYSIEQPTLLGAAIAGIDSERSHALSAFGLHAGAAFQMRDDVLGVFGDPLTTGKPAGDDLREGKRTVLIGLARAALAPGPRQVLDGLLGSPNLTEAQVNMLQNTIRESGALDQAEQLIALRLAKAEQALTDARPAQPAAGRLLDLATAAARRVA